MTAPAATFCHVFVNFSSPQYPVHPEKKPATAFCPRAIEIPFCVTSWQQLFSWLSNHLLEPHFQPRRLSLIATGRLTDYVRNSVNDGG